MGHTSYVPPVGRASYVPPVGQNDFNDLYDNARLVENLQKTGGLLG